MHITFRNLGTIEETTLELAPLTVVIGPNNSFKTWLAYCVYGLCRAVGDLARDFPAALPQALEVGVGSGQEPKRYDAQPLLDTVVQFAVEAFRSSLGVYFQDASLFERCELELRGLKADKLDTASRSGAVPHSDRTTRMSLALARGQLEVSEPDGDPHDLLAKTARDRNVVGLLCGAVTRVLGRPLVFPAERTALTLTYRLLSLRRFRELRDIQRSMFARGSEAGEAHDGVSVTLPQPVEDFVDMLADMELDPRETGFARLSALATTLEQALHGPHRLVWAPTPAGGRRLALDLGDDRHVGLYNASSSIKQLTPLVLYLRHRAQPGDLLVIDEPEINLHPETQAKVLETLAIMVREGMKVLVTTHSPYLMSHLNNLVAGDMTDKDRRARQADHLYLKDPRAFLSMDEVSAYVMGPSGLESLVDPDVGIRWDSLSDVSVDIQQRYFRIAGEGEEGDEEE